MGRQQTTATVTGAGEKNWQGGVSGSLQAWKFGFISEGESQQHLLANTKLFKNCNMAKI